MMKKILVFVLAVAVLGGVYAYKEFNRKPVDTASANPDFATTALTVLAEFQVNDSIAGKKYTDKLLQIDGVVKEITKDEKGFYTIALGDSSSMSSVRCSMDSTFASNVTSIEKGKSVSIKGVCSGYNADEMLGSDLILVRCAINK
jgi:hypothetical protein